MGLPTINIAFTTAAESTAANVGSGIAGIIVKDTATLTTRSYTLYSTADIPSGLTAANTAYIKQAFLGYKTLPRKVQLYVLPSSTADLSDALDWLATVPVDWIAAPADCDATEALEVKTWIEAQWALGKYPRAVLPSYSGEHEGIVDFDTDDIVVGTSTYAAAGYCARIAGLLCGTPLNISCTYAPLPEVTDCERLTKTQADTAVEAGKLVLIHDGEKVKVARGVNSLTITGTTKPASYKKIKLVEALCTIRRDLRLAIEDNYVGKYPNNYDSKCILLTAVQDYLSSLERSGVLEAGSSSVEIDIAAQRAWLAAQGVSVSGMTDDEVRVYPTGSQVFLAASVRILDAVEDVTISVAI